ncbi:MAG: lactate utilization protein [Planctomycetes bacterium]|nr:lactate utilization protein [Planctomycetota bacterium]
MTAREAFLERVKSAVAEGNRAGGAPPLPERGRVGYQGAGADPVERFCQELIAAGGKAYLASDADAPLRLVQEILQSLNARRILLTRGGLIDQLGLAGMLRRLGLEVKTLDDLGADSREEFFQADVGITNVHRLIAETGTVVLTSRPNEPRSASLLPPVHICLAERSQILPDLFDLFDLFAPTASASKTLPPSCLTLITGPSKTGDIELKLVTGVHGPGEVHVILLAGSAGEG